MALVLNDLKKQFSAAGDVFVALDGVSLTVPEGQFVAVMGSNGAGKSTLLNAIAGSIFVDEGTIEIDGSEVSRLAEHRRAKLIGRVFQDPRVGTAPDLTVAENVALAFLRKGRRGLRMGVSRKVRKQIITAFAEAGIPELGDRLEQQIGTMSGGQRQAVALLMAAWTKPNLLLLDEHTAALDPSRASTVMGLTEQLQREMNLTVLMVTHNPQQAIDYGDRLIMMDAGQIVVDIAGEEKRALTFERLVQVFGERGMQIDDRALLGQDLNNRP